MQKGGSFHSQQEVNMLATRAGIKKMGFDAASYDSKSLSYKL